MTRVRSELHQGKKIIVVDGTDVPATEYAEVLRAGAAQIQREPLGSVLLVTVVTRARFASGAGERVKAYSTAIKPHVKASAVVGLSPLQRVVFAAVRPFMHSTVKEFKTFPEAVAWLTAFQAPTR